MLGIDNVVFLSVATAHLNREEAAKARKLGLALALGFRIALLFAISWIVQLKDPVMVLFGHPLSVKDMILIVGGAFLIYKAVNHIHEEVEEEHGGDIGSPDHQDAFFVAGSSHGDEQEDQDREPARVRTVDECGKDHQREAERGEGRGAAGISGSLVDRKGSRVA